MTPIALALAKREVSEHDLRLGGRLPITRSEKLVARFRQHVLPCALGLEARLSIAEKKPRPGRVVLGPELERVRVEAGSGSESVEAGGAVARLAEREPRPLRERAGWLT